MNLPRRWRALPFHWLLPLAFFLFGLVYIYAAPNFEASDTVQHVGMIKWIAETGTLPVQTGDHEHLYGQEASQPPLYYLIMAAVWKAFDTSDFDARYLPSPFTVIGEPSGRGNRNLVIYKQPYPPDLRGASLALYVIRLLSLGMGAGAVWAVYQSARVVLPGEVGVAVLACSLTAFNPQFLFISASVSNDSQVTMLAALIAWRTLVMLRDGFEARRSLALALLVALASLAKLSGLVLGAAVGLAALWLVVRRRDWRGFFGLIFAMLACWLLIAGPWHARNLTLYGELTGTSTMLDFFGRRSITLGRLIAEEFQGLRVSYWAVFGAFNIVVDELFYRLMDLLCAAGALGIIAFLANFMRGIHHIPSQVTAWLTQKNVPVKTRICRGEPVARPSNSNSFRLGRLAESSLQTTSRFGVGQERDREDTGCRHRERRTALLEAVGFLSMLLALGAASLIAWSLQTWASTGRLLFPYITAISLLLALGIHALRIPKLLIIAPILVFSLVAPLIYIMPNYDHPPAVARLPAAAKPSNARWGDLRLSAYELPERRTWRAGDEIPITLYWRAEAQSPLAYALVLSLVDEAGDALDRIETWPGWGTMPHPWMALDTDYRDDYIMRIPADAPATELYLDIDWYVFPDGPDLEAELETGEALESWRLGLGRLKN